MNTGTAWRLCEGRLECGTPQAFFPFFDGKKHVIALVGGGGKTTLMHHLAQAFAAQGMKTAVTTTTRIGVSQEASLTLEDCRARWAQGKIALCGRIENGSFRAPDFFDALTLEADIVLAEADGAHRLPCKAPAAHEPVIPAQADTVLGVMGLDAAGGRIMDVCHRPQLVTALLGADPAHSLTPEDMARILLSDNGTRKGAGNRQFIPVLHKCDDEARMRTGAQVLACLRSMGQEEAFLTGNMRRSAEFEIGGHR